MYLLIYNKILDILSFNTVIIFLISILFQHLLYLVISSYDYI